MRRQYTDEERSELLDLVRSGRATVAEAASRLGVTLSTAYKWRRDAASAAPAAPTFVRVLRSRDADTTAIVVRVGGAEVEVRRDFDAVLLRQVVETLGRGHS